MPGMGKSLDIFDKFISIAKEIAKLLALVLLQYQAAAQDMYQICQKLLTANENLSRWLHSFIYFDFRQQNARTEFMKVLQEYKTMKNGPKYQQLKFSCSDIGGVYYQHISIFHQKLPIGLVINRKRRKLMEYSCSVWTAIA